MGDLRPAERGKYRFPPVALSASIFLPLLDYRIPPFGYVHRAGSSLLTFSRFPRLHSCKSGHYGLPFPESVLRSRILPSGDPREDITLFSNRTVESTARKRADGKYNVTINVESHKYKANPKGNEIEVSVDDWMDIGAFAKPEKDRKYGKTLYREQVHVTQPRSTYTFVTDELPDKAGIDPFLLLIDRVPDDNTMKVTLSGSAAAD